jgi:hypothetical protein
LKLPVGPEVPPPKPALLRYRRTGGQEDRSTGGQEYRRTGVQEDRVRNQRFRETAVSRSVHGDPSDEDFLLNS